MRREYDTLVVGAGFAGSVMAERLAVGRGPRVLVIDRRDHIAGNAYDYFDEHGVLVHKYGPHIFHTNSEKVVELPLALHRVAALRAPRRGRGRRPLLPIPINRTTVNELYGLELRTDEEVAAFYAERAEPRRLRPHLRGRRRRQGRARPLREVLPRLHAQAVGA